MRIIGLLLIANFFVSCGYNTPEETTVEERNYSVPAPQYIVVRESNAGDRTQYRFVSANLSEDEVIELIQYQATFRQGRREWNGVDSQQVLDTSSRRGSNGAVSFVSEPKDFQPAQRGYNVNDVSSAQVYNAYNGCYTPSHIYYGNNGYNHCYPQYYGYNNYRYLPSFSWRNTYYYYRPFYQPYRLNNWNYYFYRWGF